MTIPQMLESLVQIYGKQNVLVHTEHHIQVVDGKHKHDIWRGREGRSHDVIRV